MKGRCLSIKAPFISILLCLVLALCPFPIEAAAAAENTARVSVGNNYCLAILDDNTLWGIGQFTHEGRLDSGNRSML